MVSPLRASPTSPQLSPYRPYPLLSVSLLSLWLFSIFCHKVCEFFQTLTHGIWLAQSLKHFELEPLNVVEYNLLTYT